MNDYWVVIDKQTGRTIAHCGEERDAIMMIILGTPDRIYRKQKFISDHIINVNSTGIKELGGQQGLPSSIPKLDYNEQLNLLTQSDAIPLNTK